MCVCFDQIILLGVLNWLCCGLHMRNMHNLEGETLGHFTFRPPLLNIFSVLSLKNHVHFTFWFLILYFLNHKVYNLVANLTKTYVCFMSYMFLNCWAGKKYMSLSYMILGDRYLYRIEHLCRFVFIIVFVFLL